MSADRERAVAPAVPAGGWRWPLGVLLLAGLAIQAAWFARRDGLDADTRRQDTERSVRRAAARLAREDTGFFADFDVLSLEQLDDATAPDGLRGFAAVAPRGTVLETRPRLVWTPAAGASRYVVTFADEERVELWTRPADTTVLAWPDEADSLPPDSAWTWEVRAEGVDAPPARASFRVAPERERERWDRDVERITRAVDDAGTRRMLIAQLALRRRLPEQAWQEVHEQLVHAPRDPYARATLAHLERVVRLSDGHLAAGTDDSGTKVPVKR